jgi:hypothetical protein
MNIQELNIGNWILWDNSWNNEPCKVIGIDPPLLKLVDRNNNSISSVSVNSVKPMEITSQILIKNGFKNVFSDSEFYKHTRENIEITRSKLYDSDKYRITIYTKYERLCWVNIKYIHQLQNACRLVNKELEIKL